MPKQTPISGIYGITTFSESSINPLNMLKNPQVHIRFKAQAFIYLY